MLQGEYNQYGYRILQLDEDGVAVEEVYRAGNSQLDSQVWVEPDAPDAEDLDTLRGYCQQTLNELADDLDQTAGDIRYVDVECE